MEGSDTTTGKAVGSNLVGIAGEVAKSTGFYEQIWRQLGHPKFDGDMATMERMIPDLVAVFRGRKDVSRRGWSNDSEITQDQALDR